VSFFIKLYLLFVVILTNGFWLIQVDYFKFQVSRDELCDKND